MKHGKIFYLLALSLILALLLPVAATPVQAAAGSFRLEPTEGEIGTIIIVEGYAFDVGSIVHVYFSSNEAEFGDAIDVDVTAYERLAATLINIDGEFSVPYAFAVPYELNDGPVVEDVHGGDYYFYATYLGSPSIIALGKFTVLDGEIVLSPTEGTVGTEVQISGEGLRSNQSIIVKYDEDNIPIASGDTTTDENGSFTCTIIVPESVGGSHVITVIDESGNRPEATLNVVPEIATEPTEQTAGGEVSISGTGFGQREDLTITLDGEEVETTPTSISTDFYGSFTGSFLVPYEGVSGPREVAVTDESQNRAETQLTVGGGIVLSPATSLVAPGYAGMELAVRGAGFTVGATVTISYGNNDESTEVATVPVAINGGFQAGFIVPSSPAGSHSITATDGTSTATATFIMESQPPPVPVTLEPDVGGTASERAYFDWQDVDDDSQPVTYTLQITLDADFNYILLEREGIALSAYTLSQDERLEPTEEGGPYYWRVMAVDGAFNESDWSYPVLFYVGFSWAAIPAWAWYIFGAIVIVLVGIYGLRRRKKTPAEKT
jgi:hypothetical protein